MGFRLIPVLFFVLGCGKPLSPITFERLSSAVGPTLSCNANYQLAGAGTSVAKTDLVVTDQDSDSMTLEIEHQGYSFQVLWHFSLTTLYMTIKKGGDRVAFSTSRVPDKDHNDSILDVGGKPRLWISCDFVEYRPKL